MANVMFLVIITFNDQDEEFIIFLLTLLAIQFIANIRNYVTILLPCIKIKRALPIYFLMY